MWRIASPGENVKLKHRDVVVDCEVDGGLESHGLEGRVDLVNVLKNLAEYSPRNDCPVCVRVCVCVCHPILVLILAMHSKSTLV